MRNSLLGGFVGVMLGAVVLAACGGLAAPVQDTVTQDELDTQLAGLQQQITDLKAQLDAHEADTSIHGSGSSGSSGGSTPVLGLNYCIAITGTFPSRSLTTGAIAGDPDTALSTDPLIGGIALFAGNFAPRGWAFCEGQLLAISTNTALFSILGTTYGGDGRTNFQLPDLRNRAPVHPDGTLRLGQTRN